MFKNFNWSEWGSLSRGALLLRVALIALVVLNLAAGFLYFFPPGGAERELLSQDSALRQNILTRRAATAKLRTVSAKVEQGADQATAFAAKYLPERRVAYGDILAELMRLSSSAGLREGQRTYSPEPLEGSDDLTVLTVNANYQGTYSELLKFVNQVDHSDHMLILDTLAATPMQQGTGVLNVAIRFLAVVRGGEDVNAPAQGVSQ